MDGKSVSRERYVPIRILAEGGFGQVLQARLVGAAGFQRMVAIKRIRLEQKGSGTQVEDFIREAHIGGYLQHHNVVQVLGFEEMEGAYGLIMEYVDGVGLNSVIELARCRGNAIPLPVITEIMAQAADGLQYIHTLRTAEGTPLKLVHRDIKPSNLLLSRVGMVKITDFGIARTSLGGGRATQAGMIKGTLAYLSPEQARGERLDHRSDLYSLGSILFELLTLEPLFDSLSPLSVLHQLACNRIEMRLKKLVNTRAEGFLPLLNSLLTHSPDQRVGSAMEVADAMRALQTAYAIPGVHLSKHAGQWVDAIELEPETYGRRSIDAGTPVPSPWKETVIFDASKLKDRAPGKTDAAPAAPAASAAPIPGVRAIHAATVAPPAPTVSTEPSRAHASMDQTRLFGWELEPAVGRAAEVPLEEAAHDHLLAASMDGLLKQSAAAPVIFADEPADRMEGLAAAPTTVIRVGSGKTADMAPPVVEAAQPVRPVDADENDVLEGLWVEDTLSRALAETIARVEDLPVGSSRPLPAVDDEGIPTVPRGRDRRGLVVVAGKAPAGVNAVETAAKKDLPVFPPVKPQVRVLEEQSIAPTVRVQRPVAAPVVTPSTAVVLENVRQTRLIDRSALLVTRLFEPVRIRRHVAPEFGQAERRQDAGRRMLLRTAAIAGLIVGFGGWGLSGFPTPDLAPEQEEIVLPTTPSDKTPSTSDLAPPSAPEKERKPTMATASRL